MKKCRFCFLLILAACGGGGGGGGDGGGGTDLCTAPQISNLEVTPNYAFFMTGNGTGFTSARIDYIDPDGDPGRIRIEVSDGSSLTIDIPSTVNATSGTLEAAVSFSTLERGVFTAEIWLVDQAGNESNRLSVDFYIVIDTTRWTRQVSGTQEALEDVEWGGAQFVAVGGNGTILVSNNGVDWSASVSGTTNFLNGVMWDGSRYFAVGASGTILSSSDGIVWTTETTSFTDVTLEDIAWSGQIYVAVGSRSNGTVILTSPDGQTWTENTSIEFTLRIIEDVAWSGQQFAATTILTGFPQNAIMLTSTDGLTWVPITISTDSVSTFSLVWADDQFMAGGIVGRVFISPDGVNWSEITAPRASNLWATSWSGLMFVAGGHAGNVSTFDSGNTWFSSNLSGFRGIAFGSDKFVAVAGGGLIYTAP